MRIATYNVEWFANLFNRNNELYDDGAWSGRHDVTRAQQTAALGKVFKAIDADAVMVVEAPDTNRRQSSEAALEHFAKRFGLRTSRALTGFENTTQQEITLLYDPKVLSVKHDPIGEPTGKHGSGEAPRFDGVFRIDLDIDAELDVINFSKPPLEVVLTPNVGDPIRLIGVHTKSKAPHGAKDLHEQIQISIANRRKQLAQCVWIRQRVVGHLRAGEHLIVLGDFNDGPGLDEYEKLFGHSGVEVVMGMTGNPDERLYDPHAVAELSPRPLVHHTSARFYVHTQKKYLNALLDYIMISQDLRKRMPQWRIWHPFDDPACFKDEVICKALVTASDHFPVTLDLAE